MNIEFMGIRCEHMSISISLGRSYWPVQYRPARTTWPVQYRPARCNWTVQYHPLSNTFCGRYTKKWLGSKSKFSHHTANRPQGGADGPVQEFCPKLHPQRQGSQVSGAAFITALPLLQRTHQGDLARTGDSGAGRRSGLRPRHEILPMRHADCI